MPETLVSLRGIKKHFPIRQGALQRVVAQVRAVDGVDLEIERGTTLGIVGESGCGKSTLARIMVDLIPPTEGEVIFAGKDIHKVDSLTRREIRRRMNIVFQDPFSSLNPRMTVAQIVGEPLQAYHLVRNEKELLQRAVQLITSCGLFAEQIYRYPHQFSGGQRQRICIARALAASPEFIVCDEAVSALDISIQAQIINLLCDLKEQYGLTYVFISHDLDIVRFISDQVAVMYLGQVVERAPKEELFTTPLHPYTEALLAAIPIFDTEATEPRERILLSGDLPSPSDPPPGCRFHPRCPRAQESCSMEVPQLREVQPGHFAACHFA